MSSHVWDPEGYLTYADERGRPFCDLISRVDAVAPRHVVDLGCGPGNLTRILKQRWPDAEVLGVDSSPEMIDRANSENISGVSLPGRFAMRLHHVQVSCPPGGEAAARRFYATALGIPEVDKPLALAVRGGCWFRGESVEIHVGVEVAFVPAKKAHPAFLVEDIDRTAGVVAEHGFPVMHDDDFPGYRRFYTADGNGNRVEILAVLDAD